MITYGSSVAKNAILFLHGFNQSARDAKDLVALAITPEVLKKYSYVFYFPDEEWYEYENIYSETNHDYKRESLVRARKYLGKLISEVKVSHTLIKLVGYSQGATVALDFAHKTDPLTTLSISGFLMKSSFVKPGENYRLTPVVYHFHGSEDKCISSDMAMKSLLNRVSRYKIIEADHWGFWRSPIFRKFFIDFIKQK